MDKFDILELVETNAKAIPTALFMLAGQDEMAEVARTSDRPERVALPQNQDLVNPESGVIELTAEYIEAIHCKLVEMFTGDPTILARGTFEELSTSPYGCYFGKVLYPSIFDKAAKYLRGFDGSQVFADGNKRTSIMTAITLLAINGYVFTMPEDDIVALVMDVANDKSITEDKIAEIFKANCVKV